MQGVGGVGGRVQGARLSKVPNANDESGTLCASVCVWVANNRSIMTMIDLPISVMFMSKTKGHTHTQAQARTHTGTHWQQLEQE